MAMAATATAAADDDDLAAFFDDVENAVQEATQDDDDDIKDQNERPSKRAKSDADDVAVATTPPSTKPQAQPAVVKVVAASSVPVISILPSYPTSLASTQPSTNFSAVAAAPIHRGGAAAGIPPSQQIIHGHQQHQQSAPPPPPPNNDDNNVDHNINNRTNPHIRSAAGETWVDPTLTQWPANDFRLFIGNLAKDLKQSALENAFSIYPSFHMARIMYDKHTGKSRGYGFVSLLDPKDCARAIREKDQSWLGSRPIKVKLSEWKDREWKEVVKKEKKNGNTKQQKFGKKR
jgi:hypothetical protein